MILQTVGVDKLFVYKFYNGRGDQVETTTQKYQRNAHKIKESR